MEAIDSFEVLVDVSDRRRLYDYANAEEVRLSEGEQWDMKALRCRGKTDHVTMEDENASLRIGLMDRTITDKGFFEKHVKEDEGSAAGGDEVVFGGDFDSLGELQELPRRLLPIYGPGESVTGTLVLKLNQAVSAEKLELNFKGYASVKIRVYHGNGCYDDHGTEEYVDENRVLWEKMDDSKAPDVGESFSLLTTHDPAAPHSKQLAPGTHRFDFKFTIPAEARESTPPLIQSSHNHAYVAYRLKATINMGKAFNRGNAVTHQGIWVEVPLDIAKLPEGNTLHPVSVEEVLDTGTLTFWKSGKIKCRALMPRNAFIIGEEIPLTIEVENESKGEIHCIEAKVALQGRARAGLGKFRASRGISVTTKKIRSEPIGHGMFPKFEWKLPLDFSESSVDSNLIPVGTLDDCTLIDVKYEIIIKIERQGLHRNMEMRIPITVGNVNSSSSIYPNLD